MFALGHWTQSSPSALPLGLHVCRLSILEQSMLLNISRTWCDSVNATVGADSVLATPEAGKQVVKQNVRSRLWAPQVYLGVEYEVGAERIARTIDTTSQSFTFEQSNVVLSSQRRIHSTERFVLHSKGPDLLMAWLSEAPSLNLTVSFSRRYFTEKSSERAAVPLAADAASHPTVHPMPMRIVSEPIVARGGLANPWYDLMLSDAWQLTDPSLHDNILAISLQVTTDDTHSPNPHLLSTAYVLTLSVSSATTGPLQSQSRHALSHIPQRLGLRLHRQRP